MLTAATAALDVLQTTIAVRFWVEPSVYDPVALNCCFVPFAMLAEAGETAMEVRAAGVTVSGDEPYMPFTVAEIVAEPTAIA